MPPRFIARQLAHPTGLLGRFVGRLMNRHNAKMNAFAVEQLEVSSSDRILEIGFGGGPMLAALIDNAAFVAEIDRSGEMVESASTKFSAAVANGRAEFRQGKVEAIPFGSATFGKACTINTIYFWTSLEAGFAEIRRVLVPGGRVVVGFLPKEWMDRLDYPSDIFTSRSPTEVATSLTGVGFKAVRVARPQRATRWNVIVAQ